MNMNPWHVEQIAEMNRERIRDEMKQIRLEDSLIKPARVTGKTAGQRRSHHHLVIRIALALFSGFLH